MALEGRKAIVAKLGFDAHWRGVIVVANTLRDAGMEVVYLGHATAEEIVRAAIEEDPLLVGLSTLSGNHLHECPRVVQALAQAEVQDVSVVVGGTIPRDDEALLLDAGVAAVFPTGSSLSDIISRVEILVAANEAARKVRA